MPRDLYYDDLQQLIDDVERLRRGYRQDGAWNLPRNAHHVRLVPNLWLQSPAMGQPDTELQRKMRPLFADVLAKRQLPGRLDAPEHMIPPDDASDADIDALIAFVRERMQHGFPAVNHRFWGDITPEQAKQLMLIHSANHLRFLHPIA